MFSAPDANAQADAEMACGDSHCQGQCYCHGVAQGDGDGDVARFEFYQGLQHFADDSELF